MNLDEFRREMESYRRDVDAEARSFKDPWIALERLRSLYARFDIPERQMADRVLAEWVLSQDENLRFDALALIRDLRVVTALPALRILAVRLSSSPAPSAPFELKKVNRLVQELATGQQIQRN